MSAVYFDNNASTRPDQRVIAAMLPLLAACFGNPSSKHEAGMMAAAAVQKTRNQVASLIGASFESEIAFVSGGTEADNLAILSGLDNRPDRDEIVVSAVEHPAVLALCDHLVRSRGITVHRIGGDSLGRIDLEEYSRALGLRTAVRSSCGPATRRKCPPGRAPRPAGPRPCGALIHQCGPSGGVRAHRPFRL